MKVFRSSISSSACSFTRAKGSVPLRIHGLLMISITLLLLRRLRLKDFKIYFTLNAAFFNYRFSIKALLAFEQILPNEDQGDQDYISVLICHISIGRYIVLVVVIKVNTYIAAG